mgnify:CR=1 FL=1
MHGYVKLKTDLKDCCIDLRRRAKDLRSDTLVSIAESCYNETRADDLEKIATGLEALIEESN